MPDTYILKQNFPNPFNPTTTLNFALPEEQELVTLTVYNQLGQPVRMLLNGDESAGYKSVVWDGRNDAAQLVGTGIYFYQIRAGNFSQTRKMILLK